MRHRALAVAEEATVAGLDHLLLVGTVTQVPRTVVLRARGAAVVAHTTIDRPTVAARAVDMATDRWGLVAATASR